MLRVNDIKCNETNLTVIWGFNKPTSRIFVFAFVTPNPVIQCSLFSAFYLSTIFEQKQSKTIFQFYSKISYSNLNAFLSSEPKSFKRKSKSLDSSFVV